MRLIDADELKEKLYIADDNWNPVVTEKEIDEAPTIEAKPVVHGKWEKVTEWDEDNNAIFECTNCRHGDVQAKGVVVPYCWYCGADMRKKVE